jgi:alkylation response protein AidB-like acyl-CoA dehydrogenase
MAAKTLWEDFFPATAALMEPRITFDPTDLRTVSQTRGDEIVLNGVKCMAPLADQAEHVLVFATDAQVEGRFR